MKLEGKVALVTGTSPNTGGIAEGPADEGARLVCVDVVPDNARQCAEHLKRHVSTWRGGWWRRGAAAAH